MAIYTPNISRNAISLASTVALEMIDDPIIILDPDDSIFYTNYAAREFFALAQNSQQKFIEIIGESRISDKDSLIRQINLGGKTKGQYVVIEDEKRSTITVFSQELNLQRIIRIEIGKWEPYYLQERLINQIATLANAKLSSKAKAERIIDLVFESLNIDIAVICLREKNPIATLDHFRPISFRGVVLDKNFSTEITPEIERTFSTGKPIRSEDANWKTTLGMGESGIHILLPLSFGGSNFGLLHLASLNSIRLFRSDGNDPATAIDVVDPIFFDRLAVQVSKVLSPPYASPFKSTLIETISEHIPGGFLLMNRAGSIIFANKEAYRIAENGWDSINEKRLYRICDPEGNPLPRAKWPLFRAILEGIEYRNEDIVLDFGTHKRPVRISITIMEDYVFSTFIDTTKETQLSKDRNEFCSSIAHELRSPITPLKGLLQIVAQRIQSQDKEYEIIVRAQAQVDRLAKLIDDMMDATRIESNSFMIKKERVEISSLLLSMKENWKLQFPKAVITICCERTLTCLIDPHRFEQVVENIVENAVKYSDNAAQIVIDAMGPPLVLTISDKGVGMSQEVKDRVFERFFQGHPKRKNQGVGIGLYLTKKIVSLHQGTIEVDSKEGEGTSFTIRLPSL